MDDLVKAALANGGALADKRHNHMFSSPQLLLF